MTERCEPPEELRGVDGWHWVLAVGPQVAGNPIPMRWGARSQGWWCDDAGLRGHNAAEAAENNWRYLAPVTPPAEVEAMRSRVAVLESALSDLLADTQHAEHDCGDDDCPVRRARAALRTEAGR